MKLVIRLIGVTLQEVGVGCAVLMSYIRWHSFGLAIFHGFLGWLYVAYSAVCYHA